MPDPIATGLRQVFINWFIVKIFIYVGVQLINNVVLAWGAQQSDSVIHIPILFGEGWNF